MLVEDDEEIPICRLSKKGGVELVPLSEENADIFSKEDIFDLYKIVSECINNHSSAWYFPVTIKHRLRPVRFSIVSPGKTLKEEMIESYRERADEDLELCRKFRAFKVGFIDVPDNEG